MSGSIFQAATELSFSERDGRITVTFVRTGDLSAPVNVIYDVTSESATPGQDFIGSSGTVRFEAGADRATVTFDIVNDGLSEATETFIVSLVSIDSGTLSVPRTLRVNILDDENPVLPPTEPPLTPQYSVQTQSLFSGLNQPINFEFSPVNDDIMYMAEKGGKIRVFNVATGQDLGVFLDLSAQVCDNMDRGLMDIAVHPDFANNPYVYAFYVVDPPGIGQADGFGNRYAHVVRYTADASNGYLTVVPGSGVIIAGGAGSSTTDISGGGALDFSDPQYANLPSSERFIPTNDPTPAVVVNGIKQDYIKVDSVTHAGGSLAFGPDGALYISIGDGASPNYADPHTPDTQNLDSLAGKILRVDPITGQGLADNPFYTEGQSLDLNISRIYQYGLRNPFSMAFDELGRLFITDTGWNAFEEINFGGAGANFGWPWYEGRGGGQLAPTSGYSGFAAATTFYQGVANGTIAVTPAYAAFGHAESVPGFQNQAITGGTVVYDGDRYPAVFANDYFFSNFPFGHVFSIDTNNRQEVAYLFTSTSSFAPVHFVQGPDGYVYFADLGEREGGFINGFIGRILISPIGGQLVSLSAPTSLTEGAAPSATVTFTLASAQSAPVVITYSTLGGSAVFGADFSGVTNATVTIPTGQTSVSVTIPIINDTAQEATEAFAVVLNGATLNGAPVAAAGAAIVSILDTDPPPPGTNLLVNGSLEQPAIGVDRFGAFTSIPGWTAIAGGSIELWNAHNGVTATNGANFAELDYDGASDGFFQDVNTVSGQVYTLSFDLRGRPGVPVSTTGVEVVWNGTVVATTSPGANWSTFSVNVTGTGGANRLTIREVSTQGSDGLGALLDNFRLITAGAPAPTVSIAASPMTVTEGAGASANIVFSLSAAQTSPVTVTYSTSNGTATAGADFTGATNATVTIPAGQTSAIVAIPILDNTTFEPSESFNALLNGATLNGVALAATGSTTVTILDNDPAPPSVSVAATPASVTEGTNPAATVTFTLNSAQASPVTVTYSTQNGTAVAGGDFTGATSATVTIPAGQTTASVTIPLINDSVQEATESFSVVLNGATLNGAAIAATGSATVSVLDNDGPPPNLLVNGSLEAPAVPAGTFSALTAITGWTAISGGTIERWNALNGVTATQGVNFAELDYDGARDGFFQDVTTAAGQIYTLTFDLRTRPGIPASTCQVEVVWNGTVVATAKPGTAWGAFTVNVTGTGGADRLTIREVASQGGDGLGAMLDNFQLVAAGPPAPTVTVSATPATVAEGLGANATVTFTLNAAQTAPVTVTYSTQNGSAAAGADFTGVTGATITIPAGQTSVSVNIPLFDDALPEATENFSVVLNGATLNGSAINASGTASISITDTDPALPSVTVAATPQSVTEAANATATVTFSISAVQTSPVVVSYSTQNGTASAGSDFTGATNGTVTIPAGQTSVSVAIPVLDDAAFEPTESFSIVLNGATRDGTALPASGSATVSIADNDPAPPSVSIAVTPATVTEGTSPSANVVFTLSAVQTAPVSVVYSTQNGTAAAGSDFTGATNATVEIPAGQTSVAVAVPILNDSIGESTEGFSVALNGATLNGAPLTASGSAAVTILDNDGPPPGTNILVNGSLEAPAIPAGTFSARTAITGWTAISGGTIELWNALNGVTATQGANFAELDYDGARDGFFQDVTTVAGQAYALTFDLRTRPGIAASTCQVEVVWNGVVVATATPGTAWGAFTVNVTGTGASDRLTIREVSSQGGDGLGAMLDNFRLVVAGPPAPAVTVAATPATATEGAGANANVTFSLNAAQTAPVTVTYSTQNGTATAGADFSGATNATVNIPAGQTSVSVAIPLVDNATFEPTESFAVVLNGATLNGTAITASGSASISITDNDPAPPTVAISAAPGSFTEGVSANAGVTFTLSAAQASPVTVTYSTQNGTAAASSDFTGATNATATIPAGQTSVSVAIPILNDTTSEATESFSVTLNGATLNGAAIGATGAVTLTILDNDGPPPNLLVNGSLEAPVVPAGTFAALTAISGWTAISGGTIELWNALNGVTATQGVNFAELDFGGARDGFFQDVTTVAGQAYTLTFDLRTRPGIAASTCQVEVVWNGTVVATATPGTAWGAFSVNVTGTGGANRLTIREVSGQGGDGLGAMLDNFQLVAASSGAPVSGGQRIAQVDADAFVYAAPGGDAAFTPVMATADASNSALDRHASDAPLAWWAANDLITVQPDPAHPNHNDYFWGV